MIVAIDGPAGAGKSSIARQAAQELGFEFLDTGAFYRAATLAAIRSRVEFTDVDELARLVENIDLEWDDSKILLEGDDVSLDIRTPTVTDAIRYLADEPRVRSTLSAQQRRIAQGRDIVTEGRDQGTEVFPNAECKFFLTASPEIRARRRQVQMLAMGRHQSFEEILSTQNQRDLEDRMRPIGRLRAADDAIVFNTDDLTPEEVLHWVVDQVRKRQSSL